MKVRQYTCHRCLTTTQLDTLNKDAKTRKGICRGLRQCPEKGCKSTTFYSPKD